MKIVSKSMLKAKMLEYFRDLEASGETLIVTSNGKPVLKVMPYAQETTVEEVFADVRGQIVYQDDLLKPTLDEWEES